MAASTPFPVQQGYGSAYSVTKRPMTEEEFKGLARPYKSFKGPLGFFSLIAVIASIVSFEAPAENVDILSLMGLVCGVVALALAAASLKMRAKVAKTMEDPYVTVVRGTAMRSASPAGWMIGPVTVTDTAETRSVMRDGPATMEFIPALKMAVSVNGVRLKKGAFVGGQVDAQPTTVYQAPAPAAAYQQPIPAPTDEPPPPPGYEPQQGLFCPICGARNPQGARFCQQCARELPRL